MKEGQDGKYECLRVIRAGPGHVAALLNSAPHFIYSHVGMHHTMLFALSMTYLTQWLMLSTRWCCKPYIPFTEAANAASFFCFLPFNPEACIAHIFNLVHNVIHGNLGLLLCCKLCASRQQPQRPLNQIISMH